MLNISFYQSLMYETVLNILVDDSVCENVCFVPCG